MMETDPVCGMQVDTATATQKTFYKGKFYYFCSEEDKMAFEKEPDHYVKSEQQDSPTYH